MNYARLKWDASTGTPGTILKEGTMVAVLTKSAERSLVRTEDGLVTVWVDAGDLIAVPEPKTRWDKLTGPDEV
jgi:hypothetical protein